MQHHLAANLWQTTQAHIDHNSLAWPYQAGPIEVCCAVFEVAGHEYTALGIVTVRQRDTRVARDARCSRHTGYDFERDTMSRQRLQFTFSIIGKQQHQFQRQL